MVKSKPWMWEEKPKKKRREISERKKFGNRLYKKHSVFLVERNAKRKAADLRMKGFRARYVKDRDIFVVYYFN